VRDAVVYILDALLSIAVWAFLLRLLRGGSEVTGATLTRFYGIHVAILPAVTMLLLGLHLFMVQKHGMSVPPSIEREGRPARTMPFLPNFLLRDLVGWLSVLAVLAALAAFFPAELGKKADPFASAPAGIKPEWYFMFMFQTLKLIPAHVLFVEGEKLGIVVFGLTGVAWMLVPFWEIKHSPDHRVRPMTLIGVGAILFMVVMTIWGYLV